AERARLVALALPVQLDRVPELHVRDAPLVAEPTVLGQRLLGVPGPLLEIADDVRASGKSSGRANLSSSGTPPPWASTSVKRRAPSTALFVTQYCSSATASRIAASVSPLASSQSSATRRFACSGKTST